MKIGEAGVICLALNAGNAIALMSLTVKMETSANGTQALEEYARMIGQLQRCVLA